MHVMGDDATFIQEVTEGVSQAPEMDPEHELQELAKKFRIWKHDFKVLMPCNISSNCG